MNHWDILLNVVVYLCFAEFGEAIKDGIGFIKRIKDAVSIRLYLLTSLELNCL